MRKRETEKLGAQPSIVETSGFGCNRRAMGPRVEKDRKPNLHNEKRRDLAADGRQEYEKLNVGFNDWDRDGI